MMRLTSLLRFISTVLIVTVSTNIAYAQKFLYEGGYFEKKGDKWYEYKPDQKNGVWNWFNETDEGNDSSYIIDNGNCKVSVPKSPDKDFYILLKGETEWKFKYKSVSGHEKGQDRLNPGLSTIPRDRRAFHRAYFNEGGVCILASYCLLLDYANSTANVLPDFDSYDVMSDYLRYQNTLEPVQQLSARYIRDNHREGERIVSKAINGYCMARGWSGLIQVGNFHEWLRKNRAWADHIEIVERGLDRVGRLNNTYEPLPYAYTTLTDLLRQNADDSREFDYAAVLIYYVEGASAFHAIFLGCDKDGFFMRGPNFYDKFVDTTCDFDFRFTPDAPIVEYLIMKIKRGDSKDEQPGWRTFNPSRWQTGPANATTPAKLHNPIPVRSIKVDPKNRSGNRNLFASVTMASESDPSFLVKFSYAPEEKSIRVNGKLGWGGRYTSDGLIEYDLKQICPDLRIISYDPGFNFDNFFYQ